MRQRGSVASTVPNHARKESYSTKGRMRSNSNLAEEDVPNGGEIVHGVDPRANTAVIPPVMVRRMSWDGRTILT